tara:strand:+ start:189 stop:638 length:450 start_codon:yes stop_codon:yes gene_type:complete
VDFYKYVKLTNGENIIVMTDTDCKEFKDRKSISILNPVELSTVRMANGPMLMESTTLQPWIKIATDDVIELPTESIIVIADMKEEAIEQYKIFLEEYKNRKEDIEEQEEEIIEPSAELLQKLMQEINQESDFEPEYTNEDKRRAKRTIH